MVFPAYDQCIKASHVFNLLDARGVISVTERQSYILRADLIVSREALIGDSITAGGGNWGWRLSGDPLSAVNFGTNGATIKQIAAQRFDALALRPRYLLVEGGVNDSVFGAHDPANWGEGFETLQRDAEKTGTTVVITVTPPIADATVNRQLDVGRRRLPVPAGPYGSAVDLRSL
eukprot:gene63221-biopygen46120